MTCGFRALSETHSADPGGQDHPAPLDEKDRFVANHILNIHVEPVATCSANKHFFKTSYTIHGQTRDSQY